MLLEKPVLKWQKQTEEKESNTSIISDTVSYKVYKGCLYPHPAGELGYEVTPQKWPSQASEWARPSLLGSRGHWV